MIEKTSFEKLKNIPVTLSDLLDSPPDQIYLVLGLLLSISLGFVFRLFDGKFMRHFVSLGWGMFLLYFGISIEGKVILISALLSVMALSLSVYVIILTLPRDSAGLGVTIFAMGFISFYHIYRMIHDYGGWTIDSSVVLMYAVMRSSMFANAYSDGIKPETSFSFALLTPYQREYRVVKTPTFLEFISYMFFFSTVILGPNQQYTDFKAFIEKKQQFKEIPLTIKPTIIKVLIGFACILVKVKLTPLIPLEYSATVEFGESHSILYKLYYVFVALTLVRFKYYAGWSLGDASAIASGSSLTPDGKFDLFYNINIWDIESSTTEREIKDNWNHSTSVWLRNYIYQRLMNYSIESGNKNYYPLLITSMVCAFWHGFYPTYYLGFTGAYLLTEVSRVIYRRRHYFVSIPPRLRKILSMFITFTYANYLGATFTMLQLQDLKQFLVNQYALPYVVALLILILVPALVPIKRSEVPQTKRAHLDSDVSLGSNTSTEPEETSQ